MQIGVSNLNVPIFPRRVCTLMLLILVGFEIVDLVGVNFSGF